MFLKYVQFNIVTSNLTRNCNYIVRFNINCKNINLLLLVCKREIYLAKECVRKGSVNDEIFGGYEYLEIVPGQETAIYAHGRLAFSC